ncbi:hypothetical protein Nepgr_002415 [Nepenthes gracilis]|uniref:Uncharacterized protein n=1 Tax=Nepenthes gracilis TaxID=150966 RepID=A0AAD3RY93_NEPGR|nr:hypothetical protein Nepgr_002415 [Nepenthes gracilis]
MFLLGGGGSCRDGVCWKSTKVEPLSSVASNFKSLSLKCKHPEARWSGSFGGAIKDDVDGRDQVALSDLRIQRSWWQMQIVLTACCCNQRMFYGLWWISFDLLLTIC